MPEATAPAADAAPAPARGLPPEYLGPDGAPDVKRLWSETQQLRERIDRSKAAFVEKEGPRIREEVTRELEAQRRATLPGSPDAYLATLPDRLPNGAVLLREPPGEDFRPEPGRHYVVLNRNDPMLQWWGEFAAERGLTPEQFGKGVARFIEAANPPPPSPREMAARRQALYDALGETGEARVAHLFGQMRTQIGDERAIELLAASDDPRWVQALERLVAAGRGASFATAPGISAGNRDDLATLRKLMETPAYWQGDPAVTERVQAGFARLYPGSSASAGRQRR